MRGSLENKKSMLASWSLEGKPHTPEHKCSFFLTPLKYCLTEFLSASVVPPFFALFAVRLCHILDYCLILVMAERHIETSAYSILFLIKGLVWEQQLDGKQFFSFLKDSRTLATRAKFLADAKCLHIKGIKRQLKGLMAGFCFQVYIWFLCISRMLPTCGHKHRKSSVYR